MKCQNMNVNVIYVSMINPILNTGVKERGLKKPHLITIMAIGIIV